MADSRKQLWASLVFSGLILVTGVLLLLVWFFGDSLGFTVQIAITAVVILVWIVGLVVWLIVRGRRKRQAQAPAPVANAAQVAPTQQQKNAALPAPSGNYPELMRGVEEATQWLMGTKLGGDKKSGEPLYALPWFIVAGPVGAGKSSLALSSGFDFHALPSQRSSEQNLIRPTANAEFRVADAAVLIDTSGRYQTEGPERDEWAALLETIKSRRKLRPLDGYVLAVNAAAILRSGEQEIEGQAKVLRARLDEAMARTRTRFPVYLVFTHMDEIEGFGEFFGAFTAEERTQVWGSTIPLAQAANAHALFDAEFDQLYARLVRRRMFQLGGANSPASQLQLFKFPGRFRRARQRLGLFASALFRPNPFSESPLLRGFYFTSSGAVGPAAARRLTGGEFFARGFFGGVLLPDKEIVAAEQASRRRPHVLRNLLLVAAALFVLVFVAGMVVSYFNNTALMARARDAHTRLEGARSVASRDPQNANAFGDELDATEEMRQLLADLDTWDKGSPPITYRFGLYTGGWLNASSSDPQKESILRHAYFEAVNDRFVRPTVAKMETELRAFVASPQAGQGTSSTATGTTNPTRTTNANSAGASNSPSSSNATDAASAGTTSEDYLGTHYDLLKAYMMLSKPDKVEPAFLVNELSDYWKLAAPPGREADALRQLEYFASQADHVDAPHPEPDDALVASAQQRLTAYPQLSRVYKRITAEVNKDVKYPVNLSTIQGAREGNILTGSYNVPPAFTLEGYRAMKEKLDNSAADEFRKDDWVMKGAETAERELGVKKEELENVYYGDYVRHWQNFLQDIKVREPQRKDDAVRILRALSDENSPLDKVLREVARQTKLSAAPGGGVVGWIKSFFNKQTGTTAASAQVEKRFDPLIKLMASENGTAEYRSRLKKVADKLNANPKSLEEISKGIQAGNDPVELTPSRQFVNDMLDSKGFGSSTASDAAAQLMRRPLDSLSAVLVGADFDQMERAWQQLAAKSQALEAGFPFNDGGPDSSVAALAQFLNPQDGELTKFVNERLSTFFDETWTPKKESADKFAPDFVAYLASAKKLGDALFPDKGKQPKVEYQITVAPSKDGNVRVVIDGNTVATPDKTTGNFQWPGDKSGATVTI
ncbi:MAG: hypothetical protein M3268_10450, partial [Acidobacteriota bacterium]|nr:hypothetical protein [Acidobacteriota bacterium]